jgi:hypothetical protein
MLRIFILYCPCGTVITISVTEICVFRCSSTSKIDSNSLMGVYLRRTGYYSHKRIRDIPSINHINRFSVNCRSESLSTSRPRQIQLRISNHPGIERLSKRYRGDVLDPDTRLTYSRLTQQVQPIISSLTNDVQAHLQGTMLSSLMVSDLTPHA